MPNWVFNTLTIQDHNPETINLIKDHLNRPFERTFTTYWDKETNSFAPKTVKFSNPVFAFWNIISPTDLEAYEKQTDYNAPMFSGDDWYSWNNRHWGTKWDVAVSDEEEYPDTEMIEFMTEGEDHWLVYRFNTAWAPPVVVLEKLSNLYPTAVLTLDWQEEQGFGGQIEFVDGQITSEMDYDSQCRDCDSYNTMEYCDTCETDICSSCNWMGEADLDGAKECQTHKIYLDNIPDYRKENA